jgi:hypothetical protein
MTKRTKILSYLIATASLLAATNTFANGDTYNQYFYGSRPAHHHKHHWHEAGYNKHHWHKSWRQIAWHHHWLPAKPAGAFNLVAKTITTAAIIDAHQPRIVHEREHPLKTKHCHEHDGYRYCKIVTYT